jgi:single-strand DNA-binding protein
MLNSCTFIGRLSKDVELRITPNGKPVANFTLAVKREMPDQNGDYQTDFLNFVCWGKPSENMANILTKGDTIAVESRVQVRSYDGTDGKKVYVTEFIVNGFPKYLRVKSWENGNGNTTNPSKSKSNSSNNPYDRQDFPSVSDDDLPF